jgi:hypothetical protein
MAFLMISAEEPCIGALMAVRRACCCSILFLALICADIIKKAMLDVDAWIGRNNPDIKMIMQVHDELVFEVNASKADEFADKIILNMQNANTNIGYCVSILTSP